MTASKFAGGCLFLAWIALTISCARPVEPSSLGPGTHDLRLEFGRSERSYLLHLPPSQESGGPLPLLIAFHGGGGNASGYQEYSGLDAVADREGFAVVYPDGTGKLGRKFLTWNAGGCCGPAMRDDVDDVGFVRALIPEIARRTPIDPERIYATGHSNGAMMSYRLAAQAPELVAAIAPVGGAMKLDPFEATRPMPVLHIHSVDDPRALYDGGLGPPFPLTRNRVHHNAVEVELRRWIVLDDCPAQPELVEERTETATGHTAKHYRYAPCSSGAEIELWKLTGAGHGWPGSKVGRRSRLVGPETQVIDASVEVWRFVERFQRRAE